MSEMAKNTTLFALVGGLIVLSGFYQGWNNAILIVNMGLISAIMAIGVNLQWGFAGLFNVGIMGFVALGGLATVLISMPPTTEAWTAGGRGVMLGLLLATIGLDLIYGTNRFTFGDPNMMGGLNFIAVLIGLFAIPEILSMVWNPKSHDGKTRALGDDWVTFQDYKDSFKSIVRGSFIGVFLGSIPGIGAAPSAFLSYSEARRTSKNRANFGKGELEGVAAAEAGNNGVAGATLIPLLALGVPGDVITAIIMGAFMVHGLQPGPMMFILNADIIYGLFIGLIVSSVFLYFIGSVAIRGFKYVADIPRGILFPGVLVMCIYGVYAVNNNLFDVGVMFVMGWVGFFMLRHQIPAAPFLIAFILGPLLEDNFRQAMLMSGSSPVILFRGPITWFFWGLTCITVFAIVRAGVRATRKGTALHTENEE
ncbi:MAG: C4-dicarboxylate ABC transporter permease [Rhodobacteraceae bacterium]|nr:MAG: C4-dicarboxylate ABC transporter permease [Paracoccaceae bacterium]